MTKQELEQLIGQLITENVDVTHYWDEGDHYIDEYDVMNAASVIVKKLIAEFNIPLTQG